MQAYKLRNQRILRGSALITALLLVTFLTVLGVARLFFAEENLIAARHAQIRNESYYLALSGIHYFLRNKKLLINSSSITIGPKAVPEGDTQHFFEITLIGPFTLIGPYSVRSRGFVLDTYKKVISERTLEIPRAVLPTLYEIH